LGYKVDLAEHGEEALARCAAARARGRPYHAVIMDLTVPGGMGGKEAVARLREMDSHVPVVVSSGYSEDPVLADYRAYGFQAVVRKPYRLQELGRALERLLGPREG